MPGFTKTQLHSAYRDLCPAFTQLNLLPIQPKISSKSVLLALIFTESNSFGSLEIVRLITQNMD